MLIYVITQYYYGDMLLVEAFTDKRIALKEANRLNFEYATDEHYYEVEAIDLDNLESIGETK